LIGLHKGTAAFNRTVTKCLPTFQQPTSPCPLLAQGEGLNRLFPTPPIEQGEGDKGAEVLTYDFRLNPDDFLRLSAKREKEKNAPLFLPPLYPPSISPKKKKERKVPKTHVFRIKTHILFLIN